MESFNLGDIKAEKANAISRYRRIQRITTLFRAVELFVFLIVVSKFSTQLSSPLKLSEEYFRGISVALISPRFVFLLGNAIVLVLFLKSGGLSAKDSEGIADFYDEYVEKCRMANQEIKKGVDDCESRKIMCRSSSEKLEREVVHGDIKRRRELKRSMTDGCRSRRKLAVAEEMSNEEFRQTVEAFIARQQRLLREED
ncbi:hypothetical protein C2S51_025661 [Perilla frutescens var. frutescens]|nr:hypothetical protein C2S51_025661 [Perilla frutescens var. frutescens]